MSNIRIELSSAPETGQDLVFRAPVDCSDIDGLIIYFPNGNGGKDSRIFNFSDAHGEDVGSLDLFAENTLVKVVIDMELRRAYVQNSDTNDYLEGKISSKLSKSGGVMTGSLTLKQLVLSRGYNYGTKQEMESLTNMKVGQLFFVLDE